MVARKSSYCNKYAYIAGVAMMMFAAGLTGCFRKTELPAAPHRHVQAMSPDAVNINTASVAELEKIPHIGEKLARDIVDHRERHGPFRKAEHLILIQGISDARFRKIRSLIRVD